MMNKNDVDTPIQNKTGILLGCNRVSTIVRFHHLDLNEKLAEKVRQ